MNKKKWIRLGKSLLFPHKAPIVLFVLVSIPLLIYSLGYQDANPIITYASYLFSAYTLTVFVVQMPPLIKWIKRGLYANRYSSRYLSEPLLRAKISLYAGLTINVLYAVFKFLAGMYYRSFWIGAIAVYYVILSIIRFGLVKRERKLSKQEPSKEKRLHELKSYRFCGYLMLLLHVAVAGLVIQMIWQNKSYSYPGFLIYAFAAYAFYCFGIAIKNMVKYRNLEHPLLAAAKMISFACALTSILAMQTAMLTQFGNGQENFARLMNSLTGGAVCMMVFILSLRMIRRAGREMKKVEES